MNTLIRVSDVEVQGANNVKILSVPSLEIEPGFTAVIGPSGSGKTTLLHTLIGLKPITSGEVTHHNDKGQLIFTHTPLPRRNLRNLRTGNQIERLATEYRSQNCGYVPQLAELPPYLTPEQYIRLTHTVRRNRIDTSTIQSLAGRLGIAEFFDRPLYDPDSIDLQEQQQRESALTRPCGKLSVGQRQRVCIIGALAHSPTILFADEPTASLDTMTGENVYELLHDITSTGRQSAIVVSHDPRIHKYADQVVRIRDGVID